MCQRIAIVFLVGIVMWSCSVSFGMDFHYRIQAVGLVGESGD